MGDMQGRTGDGVEGEWKRRARGRRGGGDGKDYSGSPVEFVCEMLGGEPYSKQEEVLRSVAESRRTSVVGCNGSGKDWAAARAVLWWLHTRSPSKAVVTGPTSRQVDHIVWNEIRHAYAGSEGRLKGRMFKTSRYEVDDRTFAIGFATNSPYNLQGFHSPNLLVVITEAHAVSDGDMDGLRRLNPARLLMTGNPFTSAGVFYDSHHLRRGLYRTVRIGAFDTPNVAEGRVVVPGMITEEDIADRKAEWGARSAQYVGGVLGEFPEGLEDVLVTLRSATEAAGRSLAPAGQVVLGCDVARFGHDKTVVVRRQGPVRADRVEGFGGRHDEDGGVPARVLHEERRGRGRGGRSGCGRRGSGPAEGAWSWAARGWRRSSEARRRWTASVSTTARLRCGGRWRRRTGAGSWTRRTTGR